MFIDMEGRVLADPPDPRLCNLDCIRFGMVFAEAGLIGETVGTLMFGVVVDRDERLAPYGCRSVYVPARGSSVIYDRDNADL